MNRTKKPTIILILLVMIALSGCGKEDITKQDEKILTEVRTQLIKDSRKIKQSIEYPAVIASEQEAKIIAKTSGTARNVKFEINDRVSMGQILANIDEINAGNNSNTKFSAAQVKQAQIAVEQTAASLNLARNNYQNLLLSSEKDLLQAEIAKNQSGKNRENLDLTTAESIKSAQLAYETAKIAREQAKINLDNRINLSDQSLDDSATNSETSADAVANSSGSLINSVNNITDVDDSKGVELPYKNNLGALDTSSYQNTQAAYSRAKAAYENYQNKSFASLEDKINNIIALAELTKKMTDSAKLLFEKTITSGNLPQTSAAGYSLAGLQSTAAGYQSAANANLSQINAARQALKNTGLNNDTTIDNLKKAYELAQKQEESAKQSLENLKAGNTAQIDNASFSNQSASNQYNSTKIKLDSQISVSKSQLDLAALSYNNAVVALQNLYDIHQAVSPINGFVVKKSVSDGDTISAGQVLAVISQSENVKMQFYASQDDLDFLSLGQSATVRDSDNKAYQGVISSITMQADPITKRYLVEVRPKDNKTRFPLGAVVNIAIDYEKSVGDADNIILPISAVEISQNSNSVTIVENNLAKKIPVKLIKIEGENVEIGTDLPGESQIVIEGNKLIREGEEVKIKNN